MTNLSNRFYLSFVFYALFVLSISFVTKGCSTTSRTLSGHEILGEGTASWYGPGFQGNTTASGEIYDQNKLTAAHLTLPFNTVVRVVNLNNNKSVDVRINDRGPFIRNRIIDLSFAAAKEIDMINEGLVPVRIVLLHSRDGIDQNLQNGEIFTIQIASLNSKRDAQILASKHEAGWVQDVLVNGVQHHRVFVGRFTDKSEAESERRRLRRQGVNGFVKQVQN